MLGGAPAHVVERDDLVAARPGGGPGRPGRRGGGRRRRSGGCGRSRRSRRSGRSGRSRGGRGWGRLGRPSGGRGRRRGRTGGSAAAWRRRLAGGTALTVDVGEDVAAGHPAALARPRDLRRVEPVLGHEPADHRREQHPGPRTVAVAALGPRRRCLLRRPGRRAAGRRPAARRRLRLGPGAGRLADLRTSGRAAAGTAGLGHRSRHGLDRLDGLGLGRRRLGRRSLGGRRFRRRGLGRRGGLGGRRRRLGATASASAAVARRRSVAEHGQAGADRDRLALRHQDLNEVATGGGRHLGVDLVGGHLEDELVGRDLVADLLEPPGDRALGDRLAQLRHGDVHCGAPYSYPCGPSTRAGFDRSARGRSRRKPPTAWGGDARRRRPLRAVPPS